MTTYNSDDLISNNHGVFLMKANGKRIKIADPITYAAEAIAENSTRVVVTLAFKTGDGRQVEIQMPPADFRSWPKWRDFLLNNGYDLPHDQARGRLLHQHLLKVGPAERRLIVHRIGWRNAGFLLPGDFVKDDGRTIAFQPPINGHAGNFEPSGTLEGWRDGVAAPALASSRLMLSIAMAFATPLLRFTDFDNCGIHLFGPSSKGKTTCLLAARSVNGKAERGGMLTWNITEAGLAETAMGHNDTLMTVDELANVGGAPTQQAKEVQKSAFMLASGRGRTRSKAYETQHNIPDATWCVMFLSSGEKGLYDLADENAVQRLKGEVVRFIDLPAIVDKDLGIPNGSKNPLAMNSR